MSGRNCDNGSQSPDGDFFDPEQELVEAPEVFAPGHSPLTGIFLIRSSRTTISNKWSDRGHSPLTGIFLIRRTAHEVNIQEAKSHSPLTGIFLIRSNP